MGVDLLAVDCRLAFVDNTLATQWIAKRLLRM
jgi:hypothetical protein